MLFDDPVQAGQLLGSTLTQHEVNVLRATFNAASRAEITASMKNLRGLICKQPPCVFAPVIPGRADLCAEQAA